MREYWNIREYKYSLKYIYFHICKLERDFKDRKVFKNVCDHANMNKYKTKKAQIQKITIKVLIMDNGIAITLVKNFNIEFGFKINLYEHTLFVYYKFSDKNLRFNECQWIYIPGI